MRRLIFLFQCYVLAFIMPQHSYASHILGGELQYANITDSTYNIVLTLYGDCSSGTIFKALYTATPIIEIYNGDSRSSMVSLYHVSGTGTEVSPVCPAELGNTTCNNPMGLLPGIKKFEYVNTITLPYKSANWRFLFNRDLGGGSLAARSSLITNISAPTGTYFCLVATLNNLDGPNASPTYASTSTPYFCDNSNQQYNQGAIDPDNDSLSFTLTQALNYGQPINYTPPYTAEHPLASDSFLYSSYNGELTFTPNATQNSLVVNRVNEYRNGVLIGSSMREMLFVIANCQNSPPVSELLPATISGGDITANGIINACTTSGNVSFDIYIADPDGDTVTVTTANIPTGASGIITNNNTTNPTIHFNWPLNTVAPGIYNFYVTLNDNHCPITSTQTIAYTIKVVAPNSIKPQVILSTQCLHQAYVALVLDNGIPPRTVSIKQNGHNIKQYITDAKVINDSLPEGNYILTVSSSNLSCITTDSIAIIDTGSLPIPPHSYYSFCKNDTPAVINYPIIKDANVFWFDEGHNDIPSLPPVNTNTAGTYTYYVTEQYKACISILDTISVTVHNLPDVSIPDHKSTICLGDTIYLYATGASSYTWMTTNPLMQDNMGKYFIQILEPEYLRVTGVDEFGCTDTALLQYLNIDQCCRFSYPDAFTPNADLKNDRFKIVIYGHTAYFECAIYNRWGQRVHLSYNPAEGWDGTYKGVPCAMDTYYYSVHAKCLTGHEEYHKGNLILIR